MSLALAVIRYPAGAVVDRGTTPFFVLQTSSGVTGLRRGSVQVVRIVTASKSFYISLRTADPSSLDGLLMPGTPSNTVPSFGES